jgi:Protein of unknown function (DUF2612)
MTNDEIIQYYAGLLILQYLGQPKAYATMEALVGPVIMNQLPVEVQNAFTVGDTVVNGTQYPGAVGVQLDVLGKYAGVTRYSTDLTGNPVTLSDQDFTKLIQIAIIQNNSGSSLYDIQKLLHMYFPNEIFVYDGADMQMSYLIASSVGNQTLVEVFITEGLLPKPMGVQLSTVVYIPTIDLFGFQDYSSVAPDYSGSTSYSIGQRVMVNGIVYTSKTNGNMGNAVSNTTFWQIIIYPFNDYATYPTYQPYKWLSYADGIHII